MITSSVYPEQIRNTAIEIATQVLSQACSCYDAYHATCFLKASKQVVKKSETAMTQAKGATTAGTAITPKGKEGSRKTQE
ncbi:hypothetical protein E2C01_037212 [Portunus trituberculatus]|uniref:Uncharacterized protein n=1 Tax=Portunus trituberculatus TaxID=210409 RepID=A0A5B7FAS8_PORTR|nr:hypothetical protein [Portunus trituberculatus]